MTCTACRHPTSSSVYRCSAIPSMTPFPYCPACAFVRAENRATAEWLLGPPDQQNINNQLIIYNEETDWYMFYHTSALLAPFQDPTGNLHTTRAQLNDYLAKTQFTTNP